MSFEANLSQLVAGLTVVLKLPAFFLFEMWSLSSSEKSLYQKMLDLAVPIASTVLVILPQTYLFHVYKFFAAVFVLVVLHFQTQNVIENDTNINYTVLLINCFVPGIAGHLIGYLCSEKPEQNLFFMAHIIPLLTKYLGLPFKVNQCALYLTDGIFSVYFIYKIMNGFITVIRKMRTEFSTWTSLVNILGVFPVAKSISDYILLPQQLLLFWLASFAYKLYYYTIYSTESHVLAISKLEWMTFLAVCAGECCKTYVGLVSMCVVVSYMANYLFLLVHLYLHDWKGLSREVDHSVGWMVGGLTFVHSLSTGILMPSNTLENILLKGSRVKIMFYCEITLILDMVFELVDPAILSLSTIPTTKLFKHIQSVIIYLFITVFSLYVVYIQQSLNNSLSIVIVILIFSTSLQATASIIIYLLFVYDGVRLHPLENLDDIVYYIRSTVRFLDFVGSVILACIGIWLIKSGGFNWAQFLFFVLHCYSNVWVRFQNGWKIFMLRRDSVKKVDALESATEEQIRDHDDVCSICLCSMSSAKVTQCGHFFHRSCLKKWMYVGDSCPHCQHKLSIVRQS